MIVRVTIALVVWLVVIPAAALGFAVYKAHFQRPRRSAAEVRDFGAVVVGVLCLFGIVALLAYVVVEWFTQVQP